MSSHHNTLSSVNDGASGSGINQSGQNAEVPSNNDPDKEREDESSDEDDPSVEPSILADDDDDDDDDDDGGAGSKRRRRNAKSRPQTCKQKCKALKDKCDHIRRQWFDEVNNLKRQHAIEVRDLKKKIKDLEDEVRRLSRSGVLTWKPWENDLFAFLERFRNRDPNDSIREDLNVYDPIYNNSCSQGNMSLTLTHPDLNIANTLFTPAQIERHFAAQDAIQQFHGDDNAGLNAPFSFEKLPIAVQCKIWRLIVPNHELIHCLSRLDSKNPPIADYLSGRRRKYPSRFHIGDGLCYVALADKPSTHLDYLCVSRRWLYALAHLFYATNTFAFSSLGELGRFFKGIGRARTERVVHVELLWQGRLTPRQPTGSISLRKEPLHNFMFTSRLRTLVVHIDESAKSRMRRSYEMKQDDDYYKDFGSEDYEEDDKYIFQMETQRTDLQMNYRKYRGMRTVHGMDFIYQLRGMKWVRFYDIHGARPCTYIRDKSFLLDINNSVTEKKSDSMALKSEIENLRPLTSLSDYFPDDQTMELVAKFYDETTVENVSVAGSDTSSSASSEDSDSDSDDDDDSSGDSSGNRSRRKTGGSDPGSDSDVEVIDIDSDGDDDEDRPDDSFGVHSDANSPSRSGFDKRRYNSSNMATVEPAVIMIEDDDDDSHRRHRRNGTDYSTSDGLFVRSGSCTAYTDDDSDEVTVISAPPGFVDLTLDDDDDDNGDNGIKIDDTESDQEEEDVKPDIILDNDDDDDDDDDSNRSIKLEESIYETLQDTANPDSDSSSDMSLKRSASEYYLA
ncbi:hypothetical protein F5B22DRAFT_654445 [Xylaria bambusicola]|uniref:uncharacterized protein n=1 Tax=Xylaria bambusicola TaxID=326684 RepID=UPI0020080E65|nr:uncharacterized protein F5B22DRAFT_654445 [Xylaria bambusicola]KAI0518132.1 hypothetical protein F5B22DRAFT_654445 [Xylaria bambusicola]